MSYFLCTSLNKNSISRIPRAKSSKLAVHKSVPGERESILNSSLVVSPLFFVRRKLLIDFAFSQDAKFFAPAGAA
jgi:hypothetical protein